MKVLRKQIILLEMQWCSVLRPKHTASMHAQTTGHLCLIADTFLLLCLDCCGGYRPGIPCSRARTVPPFFATTRFGQCGRKSRPPELPSCLPGREDDGLAAFQIPLDGYELSKASLQQQGSQTNYGPMACWVTTHLSSACWHGRG